MLDIRRATAADRDDLVRLLLAQLGDHGIDVGTDRLTSAVDGVLDVPGRGLLLVARDAGTAIGVAYLAFNWTLEHGGRCAWLEELYVVPDRRSSGVGTQLLDSVRAEAVAEGCRAIDLEVDADHARAANLYARKGFRPHRRARWVLDLAVR